jgi:hypothetical protein
MAAFSGPSVASGQLTSIPYKFREKNIRRAQLTASFAGQTGPEKGVIEYILGIAVKGFFNKQPRRRVGSALPGGDGTNGTAFSTLYTIPRPVSINNFQQAIHDVPRFPFKPLTKV